MPKLYLPHVVLPTEFITLLKTNLSSTSTSASIFEIIRPNQAIYCVLEKAFREFDDGRGLEKTMAALGWANFRDRMASIYIYKAIYGNFPNKTSTELVEDLKVIELQFASHGVNSLSRLFLLGFYLKLSNIETQRRRDNPFIETKIPENVSDILRMSQGRSEKIDWLILISMHLMNGLGEKIFMNALGSGKKLEEIYQLLTTEFRKNMLDNLLAYGASIDERDVFLYEKV